jgi:hypothetical protein
MRNTTKMGNWEKQAMVRKTYIHKLTYSSCVNVLQNINEAVHQQFICFKKAYNSLGRSSG